MEGNDSFRLVVRRGPQPNQIYDLNKDIVTLGRDITNDIVINDPEVSRHHLRLTRGAGGFTIEDLGSTNGTFINGQRLSGAKPLNNGDMVGLGETVTLGYEGARHPGVAAAPGPSPAMPETAAHPVPQQPPTQQPPYQSQAPVAPSPYQPPSAGQPAAQQQQQQQQPYAPAYGQQEQQPYYAPPAAYEAGPPGAGYEYDPYAIREEESRGGMRWIMIGCVGLTLFCCCATIAGLLIIDAANLWDKIPIVKDLAPLFTDIARALGFI